MVYHQYLQAQNHKRIFISKWIKLEIPGSPVVGLFSVLTNTTVSGTMSVTVSPSETSIGSSNDSKA